ncbi:unnamed protein product [Symbiodinium sp. KB8]|nr:unnamed protein product [Symbiodinium sp. KB8]
MSSERGAVERLVLQLRDLRISIERTPPAERDPSPAESFELVEAEPTTSAQASTGPLAGEASTSQRPEGLSPVEDFIEADCVAALEALNLGPHESFTRNIAAVPGWTARARIARAFRAGLSAAAVLAGKQDYQSSSLGLPVKSRIYVVLRCAAKPYGFVCESYRTFLSLVPKDSAGRLERSAAGHGLRNFETAGCRPLPMIYLVDNAEDPAVRITAFLLRLGKGLCDTDPEAPLLYTPTQARSTVVRPNFEAAQTAADLWITTATEDPEFLESGLGEYVTAAEDIDGDPLPEGFAAEEGDEEDANDPGELSRLRARLQALELAARTAPPPGSGIGALGPAPSTAQPRRGARELFPPGQPGTLSEGDLRLLREAAGAVPARLANHERAARTALTREADDTLAEIEAGVAPDDGPTSGDQVLQRLLLVQTQMLAKLTASKPKSPLEAALGSGGGKDEGSLSAKGSAARDAYVRLLKDSTSVAEQIRRLAAEELGEDIHSPPASLMRTFVEKRSAVGEMRTLALVSTFAAHGWEHARNTANSDMEAWMARLLMFTDQCATEGGRTQLGWLLTGLPDPAWSSLVRRRQGLRPFSRLCPSLWLSGNVAFLKEMEWLATRMSNTSDPGKVSFVHATRAQLLKLAAKWDQFQALRIFRCSEVDPMETVGCFGVPKDENFDRFILNPSVANARSMKLSCYTKLLAPGCLLAQATLPTCDHFLRFCCDDLSEMYYTFVVPIRRAKRNCLGIVFQPSELQNFSVFNPRVHNEPCFLALNALAMGDCGAVEYAQQSHFNVLASLGNCMRPSEFCAYRRPFPRGQCAEFLSIDDHMTAQVCSRSQLQRKLPLRDTLIFSGADAAYPTVGLVPHEGKRRRNVTTGVFLGADVDGLTGIVSAPRHRTGVLMRVTAMVARAGVCSPALLSLLLGLWVHVLLFRRAGFAILQQVFTDARRTPATRIMSLHRDSVNELFCLCAVAPLLQADLRATYPGFLYAMDASPSGAGLCCAALPESVLRELWRHTEQKGFYTKLLEPASALLTDLGLSEDPGAFLVEGLSSASSSPFTPEPLPLRRPRDGLVYFLCLFGGDSNWTSAHCRAGLSDYAAFEPSLRPLTFADLGDKGTFRTLAALASSGRVHDWQACPPLSVAVSAPSLVRRLCFLLCLAASAGAFVSLALPSACTLLRMHCFRALVAWGGVVTELCFCAFGSPCRTPTVFFHNKPWVLKLGGCVSQCSCESAHFVEAGRFSAASARDFASRCHPCVESVFGRLPCVGELVPDFCQLCPLPLASRFASGSSLASTGVVVPAPCSASLRSFHDDPEWIGELADCLEFGEVLRYKFGAPGHINVLEARAYKTWLKWCAKKHPNSRLVGLIDSRVLLGSAAKGRSASPALCHVLRSAVPYVLGCGLYPGGLHVYSAQNRSDGPSRGRPPAPPTKAWPAWLQALVRGDTRPFDLVCASAASVPRLLGRWLRLLLLLAGDVERNPGPFHDGGPRGAVDMEGGFAPSTRHKMDKAMRAFASWLMGTFSLPLGAVLGSAESASLALRAFGLHLYSSGQPRYLLVYALTAVQDSHPDFRSKLSSAWQVDRKWQLAEPGECRPVISQPIVQAAAALAICWGWFDWAALTLVGFLCMLHPAEMIWLTRQDLVFPEDALSPDPIMYVHIRNPKTQRFARRQHSRLEDPLVLSLLASLYLDLPLSSRLFRGSMHTYRRQWNKIMERLGVPHRLTDKGTTPGVLRGSGATFLYLETEDLPLVAWRGRWSKTKTVEFYLQEVAAQLLLQRLPQWARARVLSFTSAFRPTFGELRYSRLKEAIEKDRSFAVTYSHLPGTAGDEVWRATAYARRVLLEVADGAIAGCDVSFPNGTRADCKTTDLPYHLDVPWWMQKIGMYHGYPILHDAQGEVRKSIQCFGP